MQLQLYLKIILIFIITVYLTNIPDFHESINKEKIILFTILFLIATLFHFLIIKSKNWFRIDVLFLLGYFIVHLQWPFAFSMIGISISKIGVLNINTTIVNYATWLTSFGGVLWILGYNIFYNSKRNNNEIIHTKISYKFKTILIISITSFIFFFLSVGSSFLTGTYRGSNNWEGISSQLYLLFHITLLMSITLEIYNKKDFYENNLFSWFITYIDKRITILIIVYVILFLLLGDRGGPLSVIMVISFLISIYIKPIKIKSFIFFIIIGSIFMTMISLGRNSTDGNLLTNGFSKLEIVSPHELTKNLAQSTRTLYTAMNHVPEKRDYFYGEMQFAGVLSAVPFSQRFYLSLTGGKYYELLSAEYITYLTWGKNPHTGEGTTIVADLYLNFGTIGVLFFLFILGILIKLIDVKSKNSRSIMWIIIASMIVSIALYWSRAQYMLPIRSIIWSFALYLLFVKKGKVNE